MKTKPETTEWVPVAELKPYALNAKKHGPEQVRRIANSIKAHGWRGNPIIVDQNGVILAGHGRRLAAIELGMTHVPVVRETMTPEQARAFRLSDNRAAEGGLDNDLLKQDLLEMDPGTLALLDGIFDKKELEFAVDDIMAVNPDVFASSLDTVMDDVSETTEQRIAEAAEKRVSLTKLFGFTTVPGSASVDVTRFIATLQAEEGVDAEEAFIAHIRGHLRITEAEE